MPCEPRGESNTRRQRNREDVAKERRVAWAQASHGDVVVHAHVHVQGPAMASRGHGRFPCHARTAEAAAHQRDIRYSRRIILQHRLEFSFFSFSSPRCTSHSSLIVACPHSKHSATSDPPLCSLCRVDISVCPTSLPASRVIAVSFSGFLASEGILSLLRRR